MLEYKGKYGEAKVMIDKVDSATVQQIYEFLNHPAFTNPIAIMPDTHAGAGAVIGFTMKMTDKVIPNVIGVDIGCGMLAMNMGKGIFKDISRADLDYAIRQAVPFGTSVRKDQDRIKVSWKQAQYGMLAMSYYLNKKYLIGKMPDEVNEKWVENKCVQVGMDYARALNSVGSLGGGNHFIEVGKSENTGDYWVTVHTGSRQLGQKIALYWQRVAKSKNKYGQLSYLEGEDMYDYLMDMAFAQYYANQNRALIAREIIKILMVDPTEWVETVHNYVDPHDMIIRKGAISSYINRGKMIIPFSMRDGLLICRGKNNEEWNFSAPHGCGRMGSRKWAKETLSLDEAKAEMKEKDIYCSHLPLDEAAGAYKDPKIIEEAIAPTAEIIDRVRPVLAMKDK